MKEYKKQLEYLERKLNQTKIHILQGENELAIYMIDYLSRLCKENINNIDDELSVLQEDNYQIHFDNQCDELQKNNVKILLINLLEILNDKSSRL